MNKVTVSANALRQVLNALNGPGHLIREIQVTRGLPGDSNPINTLMSEFDLAVTIHNEALKRDEDNTTMHPIAGSRCSECKKPVWSTPSGSMCENGHGGTEEDGEPDEYTK